MHADNTRTLLRAANAGSEFGSFYGFSDFFLKMNFKTNTILMLFSKPKQLRLRNFL